MIDLTPEDCSRVLGTARVAHIGVVSNGAPYVTPVSYVVIGDEVCFRTGPGRRIDALTVDPRCCVEVTMLGEGDRWESVLIEGSARFVDDPDERSEVVAAILAKYPAGSPFGSSSPSRLPTENPIVAVPMDRVTGRASGGGLGQRLRPGRL